jgi:hypothetical protein
MYASRTNFATIKKENIFGGNNAIPVKPPPFEDSVKSLVYVPSWQIFKNFVRKFLMSLDQFKIKAM